jgi:hypothetical protein
MSLTVSIPEDLHEWVSFEDPEEERTYMFDVSYMLSNWMCIYGQGCQGILEEASPELMQGCCSFGAHFIDADDVKTVKKSSKRLTAKNWQFKERAEPSQPRRSMEHVSSSIGQASKAELDVPCILALPKLVSDQWTGSQMFVGRYQ